ncbi:hypothetical protein [Halarcobacter bivalviorum]|uniref:hypothetical protein n=1 Tax=Halarcobacter bivalviorum TaxID=663364 RepID=UPI00100B66A1|nr:hypothetical protein [Halarcobacter bivalviorum]RXK08035.1 hypothetical protein CRU97_01430 [Halarcobacter bivalviorum]
MENTNTIKKVIINKQKDIYKYKQELFNLGVKFDSSKGIYSNPYYIDDNILNQVVWFCQKHDYTYKIVEDTINNTKKRIQGLYKLITLNNNNFIVQNRTNLKYIFNISIYEQMDNDMINILDYTSGEYILIKKKIHVENKLLAVFELLLNTESELALKYENFSKNLQMLAILLSEDDKGKSYKGKLMAFKHNTIQEIKNKNQDGFLCNGVKGFIPERTFFLLGEKIIDGETKNSIPYEQEIMIWDYLYKRENRQYIGVWKNLTYNDLFIGKKIEILHNGSPYDARITKIKEEAGLLKVLISNGINTTWIPQAFTMEELSNRVK